MRGADASGAAVAGWEAAGSAPSVVVASDPVASGSATPAVLVTAAACGGRGAAAPPRAGRRAVAPSTGTAEPEPEAGPGAAARAAARAAAGRTGRPTSADDGGAGRGAVGTAGRSPDGAWSPRAPPPEGSAARRWRGSGERRACRSHGPWCRAELLRRDLFPLPPDGSGGRSPPVYRMSRCCRGAPPPRRPPRCSRSFPCAAHCSRRPRCPRGHPAGRFRAGVHRGRPLQLQGSPGAPERWGGKGPRPGHGRLPGRSRCQSASVALPRQASGIATIGSGGSTDSA